MTSVLPKDNSKYLRRLVLKGIDTSERKVRVIIYDNRNDTSREYMYTEEVLLIKIARVKRIPPGQNARHLMSILSAGLLAVRQYKMRNGLYF